MYSHYTKIGSRWAVEVAQGVIGFVVPGSVLSIYLTSKDLARYGLAGLREA